MFRATVALIVTLALSGCTDSGRSASRPPSTGSVSGSHPGSAQGSVPVSAPGPAPTRTSGAAGTSSAGTSSGGWTVTVYYTAVERFHHAAAKAVTGCPKLDCQHGDSPLGSFPGDFVQAVKDEGTGRTADGRYLNWSSDTGYWIDTAPRDTAGRALRPYESAAADRDVLRAGTRFTIVQCGRDDGGDAIDAQVCTRFKAAQWTITDEFTPGLGGTRHVDIYIGEETGTGFTDSVWYTTLVGATLSVK